MIPDPESLSLLVPVFVQGFGLGLALLVAIGAQNAFVLRQGLRREHVGSVVAFCIAADAVLIGAGAWGGARALGEHPGVARGLALAGAVFLAAYGCQALRRACRPGRLQAGPGSATLGRGAVLARAAAFTLLNPHVYLDTVLLVGGLAARQPATLRGGFVVGACSASLLWFTLLGLGARRLAPWLARPGAWRVLDAAIGLTLALLAALLVRQAGVGG